MEEIVIDDLVIIAICAGAGIIVLVVIVVVCYFFWNPLRSYVHTNANSLEDDDTKNMNVLCDLNGISSQCEVDSTCKYPEKQLGKKES